MSILKHTFAPADPVVAWRLDHLRAAGLPELTARAVARDSAYDLHALLGLVDRGCPVELAVRIVAPLEPEDPAC